MDVNNSEYIQNEEYCSLFRRKSYRSALVIIVAAAVITVAMIILGKTSDVLYKTDIFQLESKVPDSIITAIDNYQGKVFAADLNSAVIENGICTADVDITLPEGAETPADSDFNLVKYKKDGSIGESISYPFEHIITPKDGDNGSFNVSLSFRTDKFNDDPAENIYCLRINSHTEDGIVNLLCSITSNSD